MKAKGKTVEYDLTARNFDWEIAPGKMISAWGFNDRVPGPTLTANVGDTLVVRVKNDLTEPTTIHWHGLRIPAPMDGTGVVQQPIGPGETFEYRFMLPDAGTYWYHSHVNETVQVERGMYGALIVRDETDPVMDSERIFLFDDMKLSHQGKFTEPGWFVPRIVERHDGRQGNTLLINGKETPVVDIHAGQVERWRFINASSARYVYLYLSGKSFRIIGTDGGLIEHPVTADRVLLTPGERVDIVAGPFARGEHFSIESLPYNRMTFLKSIHEIFANVRVGESRPSIALIPRALRKIEPIAPQDAPVTRKIRFSVGPSLKNGMNFLVNNRKHADDKPVVAGELQIWEISNTSLMDHPFHLHGEFFQVIEIQGKAPEFIAWKDTCNLPPRSKLKIAWVPNRPGMWMYHCHILEHHEAGMMANFEVIPRYNPHDVNAVPSTVQAAGHVHAAHRH